jgi:hypothetical protein
MAKTNEYKCQHDSGGLKCPYCGRRLVYQIKGAYATKPCGMCARMMAAKEGWACQHCDVLIRMAVQTLSVSPSQQKRDLVAFRLAKKQSEEKKKEVKRK